MTETTDTAATLDIIERFNEVFNKHDVDAIMALMTDDVVFENTFPRPDGERFEGQDSVRGFWEQFFAGTPSARFETEGIFAGGDRCAVRWVYHWIDGEGKPGHVRGVDVFRVRDGKVAEKLSYVKG
jgi:ketosteroid isomerase-like protein